MTKFVFDDHEARVLVKVGYKILPDIEEMTDDEFENYSGTYELVAEVWGVRRVVARSTIADFEPLRQLYRELVSEEDEPITLEEAFERVSNHYKDYIVLSPDINYESDE